MRSPPERWPDAGAALRDCAFLAALVVLSVVLYVHQLGFYSDDWAFLGSLTASGEGSLGGLFRSIHSPHVAMRPVQLLYMAGLFRLFGPDPLGYHLVQSGMLVSLAVLGYLALRELRQARLIALSLPAVYVLLPHYASNRFWFATFMITLSMVLYLASLYAQSRAVRGGTGAFWTWMAGAVLALWLSALAYELTIPLFLLNAWLVAQFGEWRRAGSLRSRLARMLAVQLTALVPVLVYKAATTTRMVGEGGLLDLWRGIAGQAVRLDYGPTDYGLNLEAALRVAFLEYGLGLPRILWTILREEPHAAILSGGQGVALAVFVYLVRAPDAPPLEQRRGFWLRFIALGVLVFGLGYAIFLTNMNVQFTTSGIANRTAMAAAFGVAVVFVGVAGLAGSLRTSIRARRLAFGAIVGLLCGTGFVINNTLASFWVEAYRRERAILAQLDARFPTLPSDSILILDGICPYEGPVPVFESSWDLAGVLLMRHDDYSLRADVVTRRMDVGEDGLTTHIYGSMRQDYPYGERLIVYDVATDTARSLPDARAARAYFAGRLPRLEGDCPRGHEGHGVQVF
ncbi:MAG: hypothetical protein ABR599_10945 [Gemmatimonadota bacterium]